MIEFKILLNRLEKIQNYLRVINCINCDIDLVRGHYSIDGRSLVGIFALDLNKPITIKLHTEDTSLKELFKEWRV